MTKLYEDDIILSPAVRLPLDERSKRTRANMVRLGTEGHHALEQEGQRHVSSFLGEASVRQIWRGAARARPRPRLFVMMTTLPILLSLFLLLETRSRRSCRIDRRAAPRNIELIQRRVVRKLREREAPLVIGIIGGSISKMPDGYGEQLVDWLNRNYPAKQGLHRLVNAAIAGSESGVSSVCLASLFTLHGHRESVDLLLVEFAYNDFALPVGTEANPDFETSRTANFERIFCTALSWSVPVMIVEVAGFAGDDWATPSNAFFRSAGSDHALVAQHYSVPIADFALFLYTFADASNFPNLYVDNGIHPSKAGHTLIASLIAQEIVHQIGLSNEGQTLSTGRDGASFARGVSWSRLGPTFSHGLLSKPPAFDGLPLAQMPAARWQVGTHPAWNCVCSQIEPTVELLKEAIVASNGWSYGVDPSDGGRLRSFSRPGFTTSTAGAHLVVRLNRSLNGQNALLYQRSWQESADAFVWVDQDPDDTRGPDERPRGVRCPLEPKRVSGRWQNPTTQMVVDQICEGSSSWSGNFDPSNDTFMHILTISPDDESDESYFKIYGFTTAS